MCNEITVLVNSCDGYSEIWDAFFTLFKKYWPQCEYPIVLNTESKSYSFEGLDITTYSLYDGKKGSKKSIQWGERLIRTLEMINSEYIIFLLDDFFFMDYVDVKRLNDCIKWIKDDENISTFGFYRTRQPNIRDGKYYGFEKRPKQALYKLNAQAAIWRKDKLISYIRPHESAWDWEILGSIRATRYSEGFYSAIEGIPYIFKYDFTKIGLKQGKWLKDTVPFLEKEKIPMNYEKKGFYDEDSASSRITISQRFEYYIKKYKSLKR